MRLGREIKWVKADTYTPDDTELAQARKDAWRSQLIARGSVGRHSVALEQMADQVKAKMGSKQSLDGSWCPVS